MTPEQEAQFAELEAAYKLVDDFIQPHTTSASSVSVVDTEEARLAWAGLKKLKTAAFAEKTFDVHVKQRLETAEGRLTHIRDTLDAVLEDYQRTGGFPVTAIERLAKEIA